MYEGQHHEGDVAMMYNSEARRIQRESNEKERRKQIRLYYTTHEEKRKNYHLYHYYGAYSVRRKYIKENTYADSKLLACDWRYIKEAYQYKCVYCHIKNIKLTQDHVIPISKGGPHIAGNIVPACQSCNSKKFISMWFDKFNPL